MSVAEAFEAATEAAFAEPLPGPVQLRSLPAGPEWDALFRSIHRETLGGRPPRSGLWSVDEQARLAELRALRGRSPCVHRLVFEAGGESVGCYIGSQAEEDAYHMGFTGLREEWQGRGLYSAFLLRLLGCLREVGFRQAFSRHHPDNAAVLVPKLKAGFLIEGLEISPIWGTVVRLTHPLTAAHRRADAERAGSTRAAAPPRLEPLEVDEGLVLEPAERADIPELFALIDRNRAWLRPWMPWVDSTRRQADVAAFVERCQAGARAGTDEVFVVRTGGQAVGVVGAHSISANNQGCDVGYWLGEEFAGRGLMTRSLRRVVEHLFAERGLHRVEIVAAVHNAPSRAVAEGAGFLLEGIRRGAERLEGRFVDHAVYGRTADDDVAR